MVFAATGSASFDFYGVSRHGDNLFANCVLALDARTGKERWHVEIADFNQQYFSTMAPIVIGDHVLVGTGNDLDAPGKPFKAGWDEALARIQARTRPTGHKSPAQVRYEEERKTRSG